MANASDFIEDVKRYDPSATEETISDIVKHLGIALQRNDAGGLTDSGYVASTDPTELKRVVDKWAVGKLGLDEATGSSIVSKVAEEMKGDRLKQRVTFYHLVSKHAGK
jgi:hypothetical protein